MGEFGGRKNDAIIFQSQETEEIINKESALSYVHYSHGRLRFVRVKKKLKRIVFKYGCSQVSTMAPSLLIVCKSIDSLIEH